MLDTLTYADGFGRWHVLTRDTPQALTRAVHVLTLAIGYDRGGCPRDYVNNNIVSLPLSEWDESPAFGGVPIPPGAWVHFAEYAIEH